MSVAGTPSTDPWVIVTRERARYEEQFKSLKPNNGIITGEQAKGFFLQSKLPPLVLGKIWALADTDADGKMNISEFSIACKLINLKLRGFEIPKGLPPSLLASLKVNTPPAIPPLPTPSLVTAPPRPEPPKVAPIISQTPIIQTQSLLAQAAPSAQPLIPNLAGGLKSQHMPNIPLSIAIPSSVSSSVGMSTGIVPPVSGIGPLAGISPSIGGIPTGIVPPMPNNIQQVQPLISGISMSGAIQPLSTQPLVSQTSSFTAPLVAGVPLPTSNIPLAAAPLLSGITTSGTATVITTGLNIHTSIPSVAPSVPNVPITGPGATSTPRASISSLDRTASIESPMVDWAVPHATKLKYTQIFNTTDRTRTGYLSGAQARNVMVQTKLPQNILAQIWALSDMDSDGRLGCEEFVLAMHLCEQAAVGNPPPAKLPPDLVPPSFRRSTRTASISSQGSAPLEQDPASTLLQTSFEDKRKENFEKGQAELDRRRKTLLDQQRKEAEERERKEREEQDRKEKARLEAERKRMEELEKQMREQQEQERLKEEERKRQAEQREAARREMERQRQLEWEKQRLQELQNQRQKEQENVLKLKAKNQSLTIELSSLNEQVKELSQKICDTRVGVSNVKTTIDGMRSTRDSQMQEMSQLKNKLKEQNAKLLTLSQEKVKLEARNKMNTQISNQDAEQARLAFENKEVTIKNLREKVEDLQSQIDGKLSDIENNNTQLTDLRTQMTTLISECEKLFGVYEEKRNKVMEMKNANRTIDYNTNWGNNDAWGNTTDTTNEWPVDNWATRTDIGQPTETAAVPGTVRYRALYEFVARNNDEISFQPGDMINVPTEQTGEPGWLAGEIRGHTGWFPESYVEPVDGIGVRQNVVETTQVNSIYQDEMESKRLEGIAEVPENPENTVPAEPITLEPTATEPEAEIEYYIANYPYQSQEQGDLSFNAGEVIAVIKKEGDWWTGKVGSNVGIFPSNYVQKVDVNSSANSNSTAVSAAAVSSALESVNSQVDNEVSQLTENKPSEKPLDSSTIASAQVVKSKKPEIASVIAPYQATSSEQLSLARGQLIMIRKKTDSGWWEGELQAKGRKRQVGWFPASYVKVLNSSGRASGRTTPVSTTRIQQEVVIDKVIALFPYTAGNPDELSFTKDDIISVTAREEEAWWRGELNGVSGLFPSNYVTPLQQQSFKSRERARLDCITELIQTERAYIEDMNIVHEVFEIPLRNSEIISKKEIEEIFVNWREILQCNRNFLCDLYKRWESGSDTIGDVICDHLPKMTAYITFMAKQLDSAALLQKLTKTSTEFRDLINRCQSNVATKGMPLSSFLIKPMQRITRYPLLITKILENTPDNHNDRRYLEEALSMSEKFLSCVNENVRLKENLERLEWLQKCVQNDLNLIFNSNTNKMGPRRLLYYGTMTKIKSGKELIVFLFNDFLLLVQPSKSLGGQFSFQRNSNLSYKMYKQPILIPNLSIIRESTEDVESGTDSNRVLKLQDNKNNYKMCVIVTTVHECSVWVKHVERAKEKYLRVLKQPRPKSLYHGGKWLYLTVLHCKEIIPIRKMKRTRKKGKSYPEHVYCKVMVGNQEQQTDLAKHHILNGNVPQNNDSQVPMLEWNFSMQFQLKNINEEFITFVVYEHNLYSPDEFLGRAELKLIDIYYETQNTKGPITKKLILHQVVSGEILVKFDLHIFKNY